MTLQELRELTAHWAGFTAANADPGFIAIVNQLLNSANVRYSAKFYLPRRTEVFTGVSTPTITLTSQPLSNGLFSVIDRTNKRRLPIYNTYEADNHWPDRFSSSPGKPAMVEWEPSNPTQLNIWPQPSSPTDIAVFYAYVPPQMLQGTDQPWDGQYPEFHDVLAIAAALDYVEKRLGEDSAEKLRDENPYGPLNAPNWLRKKLLQREMEVLDATVRIAPVPTADPYGGDWRSPGYRF